MDVRLSNTSRRLAELQTGRPGVLPQGDLRGGYLHEPLLAPSEELFTAYRRRRDRGRHWPEQYRKFAKARNVGKSVGREAGSSGSRRCCYAASDARAVSFGGWCLNTCSNMARGQDSSPVTQGGTNDPTPGDRAPSERQDRPGGVLLRGMHASLKMAPTVSSPVKVTVQLKEPSGFWTWFLQLYDQPPKFDPFAVMTMGVFAG